MLLKEDRWVGVSQAGPQSGISGSSSESRGGGEENVPPLREPPI